jgi:hypothetical protein
MHHALLPLLRTAPLSKQRLQQVSVSVITSGTARRMKGSRVRVAAGGYTHGRAVLMQIALKPLSSNARTSVSACGARGTKQFEAIG